MKKEKPANQSNFLKSPLMIRVYKYFIILWAIVITSSLFYYLINKAAQKSYWQVLNSAFFYINIPLLSYALLSFVAQRGLFNGIRYSLKQAQAYFFKKSRLEMMATYSVDHDQDLKKILQEKYLYTSPYSDTTLPLVIVTTLTFFLMILFSFI